MAATSALMANTIRFLAADAVEAANSGHPGMPMGMAEAAVALFTRHIKLDPAQPHWPDRDRFVLSAGHGSMLQYAVHHLLGYEDMTLEQIKAFRQLGARTAGHPEYGHAAGIETTTGPLGQGIATAVGLALGERLMNARYGDDLVGHFTYVIAGDGCLMEGISHEAIDLAGHLKLGRLIVLWDDNSISIDGATNLATTMDQKTRFAAAHWRVIEVDGHDVEAVDAAIETAKADLDHPTLIACKTVIGKGAPHKQGSEKVHGSPLGKEELAATRAALGWTYGPFEIPKDSLEVWRSAGARSRETRLAWEKRLAASPRRAEFEAAVAGELPADFGAKFSAYKALLVEEKPKVATRKASEMALTAINGATTITIGGSADLTGSNLTLTKGQGSVLPGDFAGRYIHYGVREHEMAAAMNGLALHGGFIPYGGTFLVFAGYMAGAMRLSALMGLRVIYVLTHDSIGLGEDGPTHQPVETLATLRALPNMLVFRPADALETAEAWEIALSETQRPSVLALSRQNLPFLRKDAIENLTARGGYVLRETEGARDATLIGTGSEVEIALAAADLLKADGIKAAVVSMPCQELFDEQDEAYRAAVLGSAPRVAIEAAVEFGWSRYTHDSRNFVGMAGFGASAPAPALYKHFHIDAESLAAKVKEARARKSVA